MKKKSVLAKRNMNVELEKQELRYLYQEPDVVTHIRSGRLRWLGHVNRREEVSVIRKVWEGRPERTRPRDRPRMRWRDQTRANLRKMRKDLGKDRGAISTEAKSRHEGQSHALLPLRHANEVQTVTSAFRNKYSTLP
ncbi:hypothetical protein J6590_082810 [Homalodisca vitripennis]|nr:hypothetical protein J6590_082810 [Homalodisca vitripennis]